jgi:iron complex outermembrane receptor protein
MKKGNFRKNSAAWILVVSTGLLSSGASAVVEEVVVTAQKREQSLQDVSAAISAVSMDRLQSGQINNIEDLQTIVPSIYLGNDFNMAKLFIRGVGANTSTTGSETGVALHVDGAVVSRAEAQLTSFFDLERVEVLRGPQGSLYGRNAVGGSINLITAKPTEEFEGYGRVTVGDYEMFNVEGALSGPIYGDRLLGRAAFKSEDRGGFGVNPVTGNDVDDLNRQMFRAHLQYLFSDDVDFLLSGEYYTQDDASRALKFRREAWPFPTVPRLAAGGIQESPPGPLTGPPFAPVLSLDNTPTFATDKRDLASEVDPATETETWSITGTLNWRLSDNLKLVNITNYRELEGFITQDLDIAAVQNSLANTDFNATVQRRDIESEQISTELRLHFDTDRINSVLGFFYFDEDQAPVDTVGLGPVLGQPHILGVLADPRTGLFPPIGPTGLEVDGVFVDDNPATNPFAANLINYALEQCNTAKYLGAGISGQTPPPKRVCLKSDLGTQVWAIFGQVSVNLGMFSEAMENVTFKFGGRYSEEERTATSPTVIVARNGLGPVIVNTAAGNFSDETFDSFTPEIGVEWRATDDMLLYYTYSEGFKAGAGENNAGPGATAPDPFRSIIVDPEEIENHEFGLKSSWFDNRLAVNVSGYFYDLKGQQINKTVAGGPAGFGTIFENAAQTSAEGVEVEFFAAPTDMLRLSGSLSYLNSEYEDFLTIDPLDPRAVSTPPDPVLDPATDFDPNLPEVQLAGNSTRNSPEWKMNFHGEYDIPNLGLPDGGYFTIMGDVSYSDEVFFTEFNRAIEGEDSYTLVDLNLRYTSGSEQVTADFWIKNATDEDVASSTFQLATARTIGVTYMPPRTYGFTLGYRF